MGIFIAFAIGIVIGFLVSKKHNKIVKVGNLVIDRSSPEDGTYMFLELSNCTPDYLNQVKEIALNVVEKSYISHK